MKIFLLLSLVSINFAFGQVYYRLMSPTEIIKKKIDAVAKIEIYENGQLRMIGSGFYIGKEGHFVTNHHVLKPFLEDPKMKLKIFSRAGFDHVSSISILKCMDEKNIDLCLLKIKDRTGDEYFDVDAAKDMAKGISLWSIGNCQKDFNIKEHRSDRIWNDIYNYVNQVKNYKQRIKKYYNQGVKTLSLVAATQCQGESCVKELDTSPLCPGDSGGPIFAQNGQLVGMVAEKLTTESGKEIYYSTIWGQELVAFYEKFKKNEFPELDKNRVIQNISSMLEMGE